MSRSDVLVDADWVEAHHGDDGVVIVEVDEDTSAYDKGHIRDAVKIDWKADLQDPLIVLMEMADGALVDVEVFVNLPYGYDIRCEVVCEVGTVALGDGSLVVLRKDGFRSDHVPDNFQERFERAYDTEFQEWVDSVVAGQATGPSSWDGYAATAVADACLAALDSGARVPVQMRQRPAFYAPAGLRTPVGARR